MNRLKKGAVITAALFAFVIPLCATEYKVDSVHSNVEFGVRHLGLSKIKGKFKVVEGTLNLDALHPETGIVTCKIKVANIDTDSEKRDEHLKSPDFFDAKTYPEINFVSTKIIPTGENSIDVIGKLTIKKTTKEVRIPMLLSKVEGAFGKARVGLEGKFAINRFDYGLEWKNKLANGTMVVAETIAIELNIEGIAQEEGVKK